MHRFLPALLLLLATPLAAHASPQPAAPAAAAELAALVRAAVRAEDTGDPDAGRFYAPVQSITDGIAPYHWHGPDAHRRWLEALAADYARRDRANGSLALADPGTARLTDTEAYLVFPATFTVTESGKTVTHEVILTTTLVRIEGQWKIRSWTWSGPN
jgi:hypothetical protein